MIESEASEVSRSPRPAPRWSGPAAILAGAMWFFSWIMNGLTRDGTREVLGLSEPGWRTLLDPALILAAAAVIALHSTQRTRTGRWGLFRTALIVLGLGTMVAGNVLEFQLSPLLHEDRPGFEPGEMIGWEAFLFGFTVAPMGLIALGIGAWRARDLPRWWVWVPLTFGALHVLGVAVVLVGAALGAPEQEEALAALLIAFGLAWIALGCGLWSTAHES